MVIDMRFYWLQNLAERRKLKIYQRLGSTNLEDYYKIRFSPTHNKNIMYLYLNKPQQVANFDQENCLQLVNQLHGCDKTCARVCKPKLPTIQLTPAFLKSLIKLIRALLFNYYYSNSRTISSYTTMLLFGVRSKSLEKILEMLS